MKNLLYKEWKLAVMPFNLLAFLFVAMLLIPSYPYIVAFIYTPVGMIYLFNAGRENNEMYYSCLLPIPKKGIVQARFLTVIGLELIQVLITFPVMFISGSIYKNNAAGLQANWTLLGEALIYYGVFNLMFLPWFYKTGVKSGVPFLVSFIVSMVIGEVMDGVLAFVPGLKELFAGNIYAPSFWQFIFLAFGIVIFTGVNYLAYRLSSQRIEKVEL